MLPASIIDRYAEGDASQYAMLLNSIVGMFSETILFPDPTTQKTHSVFRWRLLNECDSFISHIDELVEAQTGEIEQIALDVQINALSDPDRADLDAYIESSLEDTRESLRNVVYRDEASAERELRRFALNVSLLQSSEGINRAGALIKLRGKLGEGVAFFQHDRIGRNRVSSGFFKAIIRKHLLLTFIETTLFLIAKRGSDLAQVELSDGSLGEIFSITGGTDGCRSYEDIRDRVFHPNSTSSVVEVRS